MQALGGYLSKLGIKVIWDDEVENTEVTTEKKPVANEDASHWIRLCIDMLNASPAFVEENARKHNSMSAALNQYLLFIEDWERRFKD